MTELVIPLMRIAPNDRILHLGSGDGSATRQLARMAHNGLAVGVDPSDDSVRLARRLSAEIDNLMFVLGSPDQIPWQGDFFTKVLCLERTDGGDVFRVLAPGGRAFLLGPAEVPGLTLIHTHQAGSAVVIEAVKPLR